MPRSSLGCSTAAGPCHRLSARNITTKHRMPRDQANGAEGPRLRNSSTQLFRPARLRCADDGNARESAAGASLRRCRGRPDHGHGRKDIGVGPGPCCDTDSEDRLPHRGDLGIPQPRRIACSKGQVVAGRPTGICRWQRRRRWCESPCRRVARPRPSSPRRRHRKRWSRACADTRCLARQAMRRQPQRPQPLTARSRLSIVARSS